MIEKLDPEFLKAVMMYRAAEDWVKRNRWLRYIANYYWLRRITARIVVWYFTKIKRVS